MTASTSWVVVVPVKHGARAKSRLASFAGTRRRELARAMALDTVDATLACTGVVEVIIVTSDPEAAERFAELGVSTVPDVPDAGLNPALVYGAGVARERRPGAPIAALSADLPALRPVELAAALASAGHHALAFVADADGIGTTLYCAGGGVPFAPRFGDNSRSAHRAAGARELDLPGIPSVRRDVDTMADLEEAVRLGVGPRTEAALSMIRE